MRKDVSGMRVVENMSLQESQLIADVRIWRPFSSRVLDLLLVPLEDTQHKFKIVGMNSDADVWPRIYRPARGTCTLPVLMNN